MEYETWELAIKILSYAGKWTNVFLITFIMQHHSVANNGNVSIIRLLCIIAYADIHWFNNKNVIIIIIIFYYY